MQIYAKNRYIRISPKKVKPVMDLVRGKSVNEAIRVLKFDPTKAAKEILIVLTTAVANADTNEKLPKENLFLSDLRVDAGPVFKRARIVAHSRTSPIIKRTCHITVGLSDKKVLKKEGK
jgi:large subunit ribosomal protein L22